jgi:hypothetical protein
MSITDNLRPAQIAHVLFLDIVEFSVLDLSDQAHCLDRLNAITAATPTYGYCRQRGDLLVIPTGDGMALVFLHDLAAPDRCALEVSRGLVECDSPIRLRIGIHSGLVQPHLDLTGRENLVGEGINTAHRVMECADPGHILLSGEHAHWLRALDGWSTRLIQVGTATVKHGLQLELFALTDDGVGRINPPRAIHAPPSSQQPPKNAYDVVLLYRRHAQPDNNVLDVVERELAQRGLRIFCDRNPRPGVEAHRTQEQRIRSARAVVPIVSPHSLRSEMLQYALEVALDERQKTGYPTILPIQIGNPEPDGDDDLAIRDLIAPFTYFTWNQPDDNPKLITELLSALREPGMLRDLPVESVGGGMPHDSPYYIERSADHEMSTLLERKHSIVLLRGGRQIGKTSLLARALHQVRRRGWRILRSDFQKVSSGSLSDSAIFFRHLAVNLARQARYSYDFKQLWDDAGDPGQNFEFFFRDLLEAESTHLVWFLDEVDKLFSAPFATDFFGLVRSWHNDRAVEPDGPFHRLTVVIAYATEAHLFISDLNQSPFNVGERIGLDDFSVEQILHLNVLYGSPISSRVDLERLHHLLGGQPYLTRRALDTLAREQLGFETLIRDAARDDGPFADHVTRVLASASALQEVAEYVQRVLDDDESPSEHHDAYYRLLRAGVLRQDRVGKIVFRCELYRRYLMEHLNAR